MSKSSKKPTAVNPYPFWAPRFWHGMLLTDWFRLLCKHRFRIHPLRWVLALGITIAGLFNSKMRIAQTAIMGHRIRSTPVPQDPIFILGHWRSGTTLLHELLSEDDRFTTPTTYQCFAANHFLLTESILTRLFWFLMPSRRPMDNVTAGWHAPQEDEFALCSMGIPSPYLRMAFPNEADQHLDYLDMEGLCDEELETWQQGMFEFLRCISVHGGKRIVLKSPTHTGRLGVLAKMWPDAKFIHIARNPYDVVPSTIRLWKTLDDVNGLQIPKHRDLEDYVFRAFERMYCGYQKECDKLAPEQLIEIRFEDLLDDGCGVLKQVYEQLQLGEFTKVHDRLKSTLDAKKGYQQNKHSLDEDLTRRINCAWADYFERYGYELQSLASASHRTPLLTKKPPKASFQEK